MDNTRLTLLIVAALVGLGGLIVSSQAADDAYYYGGLVVFGLAVLSIFGLIGRSDGHPQG